VNTKPNKIKFFHIVMGIKSCVRVYREIEREREREYKESKRFGFVFT
jgi:hypothetical protein